MFNVLNRFISRLDGEPNGQGPTGHQSAAGFQVLRNTNKELDIEPWFDTIIGINGRTLDSSDPGLFAAEVRNCGGTSISLGVWSAKGQRVKEIYATVPAESPSLGLSLQWVPLSATDDVWHVLEVSPNSPADLAGLLPYGDYIIGSPEGIVRGEAGIPELVEDFLERSLKLLVYNHEYNVTRPVDITPSRNWGGQGALGCTLGYGALHRIPPPLDEPPNAPGDVMFDTGADEKAALIAADASNADFLVPAELPLGGENAGAASPGEKPAPPPMATRKEKRARPQMHTAASNDMDEYFREGEEKSQAMDHAPTPKANSGLPPPPKASTPKPAE